MSFARTHARTHAIILALFVVVPGCAEPESRDRLTASGAGAPLSQGEVDALGLPCKQDVISIGGALMPASQRMVKLLLCDLSVGSPGTLAIVDESSGARPTLDGLLSSEASAWSSKKMSPGLRAALEQDNASHITVDVWMREDTIGLPSKYDIESGVATVAESRSQSAARAKAAVAPLLVESKTMPGVVIVSDGSTAPWMPGPFVSIRATAATILGVASLDFVSRITRPVSDVADAELFSENYVFSTNLNFLAGVPGLNGTGVTIANLEGGSPDSWAHLSPPGACTTSKCACAQGKTGAHSRQTMGVMRNTITSWNGTASGADVLSANFDTTASPPCTLTQAVGWAAARGARVLSRSAPCDYDSGSLGRFLDFAAVQYPYPLVVCAAGNASDGEGGDEASRAAVMNGIAVTGAEPDTAVRSQMTRYAPGQTLNRVGGGNGWELPHIAAPSRSLDTANTGGATPGIINATSAATPVVSGISASLMELNPFLAGRPELVVPALMVSADENLDEAVGGAWPLNLYDSFDDKDGAGLVNALGAYYVVHPTSRRYGGEPGSSYGHDAGFMTPDSVPDGTYSPKVFTASVGPGQTLRAALLATASPTCGSPASESNCSTIQYPWAIVALFPQSGGTTIAANTFNTLQFASWKNTTGAIVPVTVRFGVISWNGLSSSYWGLAWSV